MKSVPFFACVSFHTYEFSFVFHFRSLEVGVPALMEKKNAVPTSRMAMLDIALHHAVIATKAKSTAMMTITTSFALLAVVQ